MTDAASIDDAARRVGTLDILVNNAGVSGDDKMADREDVSTFRRVYETNVFGVVAVTNAFLPVLRRSAHPRIVNLSSGTGSLTWATGPQFPHRGSYAAYRSSKTALNALTVFYAHALAGDGIKVNALAPGLRRRGEVGHRVGGPGGIPVDERDRCPLPVDGVPRAEVAVGDDLPGSRRPRVETVAGDQWLEASGRRVQFADQPSRSAQGQIGPGIGREPVPVPRLPARVVGNIAADEGQDFAVAFDPQQPGSAVETGCLQMPQVLVHGGRPWPHRPQQPVTAPRHPAGHPPAGNRHLARPRVLVAGHQISIAATGACQPALREGPAGCSGR